MVRNSVVRRDEPVHEDQLLGLQQVAGRLSVSYVTVKRLVARGDLRSVTLGDRRLVRESDLSTFIATLSD